MSTIFDYRKEAKSNPNVNGEIIADTIKFQKFLIKAGVGKKASYKIDRPSEQRNESLKLSKKPKIVTRVF